MSCWFWSPDVSRRKCISEWQQCTKLVKVKSIDSSDSTANQQSVWLLSTGTSHLEIREITGIKLTSWRPKNYCISRTLRVMCQLAPSSCFCSVGDGWGWQCRLKMFKAAASPKNVEFSGLHWLAFDISQPFWDMDSPCRAFQHIAWPETSETLFHLAESKAAKQLELVTQIKWPRDIAAEWRQRWVSGCMVSWLVLAEVAACGVLNLWFGGSSKGAAGLTPKDQLLARGQNQL